MLAICVITLNITDLTGEEEGRNFFTTRGDSRISVQLAKNQYTAELNREYRFLIDDEDSPHKLSYQLTKPLKLGNSYNGEGTFKFVMQEVVATEFDNHTLGIADYYKVFPADFIDSGTTKQPTGLERWVQGDPPADRDVPNETPDGRKVWL